MRKHVNIVLRFFLMSMMLAVVCANAVASFVLNVGAYPKEQAEQLHQQLTLKGYPAYLLYGETYEVRVGGYESRDKAAEVADKLRSQERVIARVQEEEDFEQNLFAVSDEAAAEVPQDAPSFARDDEEGGGIEVTDNTFQAYSDPRAQKIVSLALDLYGQPYKYGGTRIGSGIDCSFFSQTIFKELGITLPRTSGEQFRTGKAVDRDELKVGDLLFFNKTYTKKIKVKKGKKKTKTVVKHVAVSRINHVGIYIGNGEFIHATINAKRVTISKIDEKYFVQHFAGARRVLGD